MTASNARNRPETFGSVSAAQVSYYAIAGGQPGMLHRSRLTGRLPLHHPAWTRWVALMI